ncbi:hypothetical protein PENTCL1PPCAC_2908, partial [Pristionchus entomophagus]
PPSSFPPHTRFILLPLASELAETARDVIKGFNILYYQVSRDAAERMMQSAATTQSKATLQEQPAATASGVADAASSTEFRARKRAADVRLQFPALVSPLVISSHSSPSISMLPSPSDSIESITSNDCEVAAKRSKRRNLESALMKIATIAAKRESASSPVQTNSGASTPDATKKEAQDDSTDTQVAGWEESNQDEELSGNSIECNLCNKKFSSNDIDRQKIRYHVLYHSKEARQYHCTLCKYNHFEYGKIKRHLKNVHHKSEEEATALVGDRKNKLMEAVWSLMMKRCFPEYDVGKLEIGRVWKTMSVLDETFSCECCGMEVPKTYLLVHIMQYHEFERLFHCSQCTRIFVSQTSRDAHSSLTHGCRFKDQPAKIDLKVNRDDDIRRAFFPSSME